MFAISLTRTALVAVLLLLGCAQAVAAKPTVAVFDFEVGPSVTRQVKRHDDGGYAGRETSVSYRTSLLTDKLITRLTQSGAVTVVERKKMARLMEEAKLSQSELSDPARATEIGRMLGADYMVFGSITDMAPHVSIEDLPYNAGQRKVMSMTAGATLRLVDTETGAVKAAADLQATQSDKEINPDDRSRRVPAAFRRQVLDELAAKLTSRIVNTIKPIKVASYSGGMVYLTRAKLPKGMTLTVIDQGAAIKDPDTGEVLGHAETPLATIEVTAGLAGMSKARVVEWQGPKGKIPAGAIARPAQ